MAQYRATIKGQRGQASRLGSKRSGLRTITNGWNSGIRIEARYVNGKDVFDVYATTGSNATDRDRLLGSLENGEWVS